MTLSSTPHPEKPPAIDERFVVVSVQMCRHAWIAEMAEGLLASVDAAMSNGERTKAAAAITLANQLLEEGTRLHRQQAIELAAVCRLVRKRDRESLVCCRRAVRPGRARSRTARRRRSAATRPRTTGDSDGDGEGPLRSDWAPTLDTYIDGLPRRGGTAR